MSDSGAAPTARVDVYTELFYDYTKDAAATAAAVVLPILGELYVPASVVDVGCGAGEWVRSAERIFDAEVLGLDGPWNTGLADMGLPFLHADLEQPLDLGRRFELAICLEVLEHLSPVAAKQMVSSLVELSDVVLFSAAVPHQRGDHHVNCRWQSAWVADFAEHGYVAYDVFRPRIWTNDEVAWWYRQNLLLMIRADSAEIPAADSAVNVLDLDCDLVHPAHFDQAVRALESELADSNGAVATLQGKLASPSLPLLGVLALRWLRAKRPRR